MSITQKRLKRLEKLKARTQEKLRREESSCSNVDIHQKTCEIQLLKNEADHAEYIATLPPVPKEQSYDPVQVSTRAGMISDFCRNVAIILSLGALSAWFGWNQGYAKAYTQAVYTGEMSGARMSIEHTNAWNQYVRNITSQ